MLKLLGINITIYIDHKNLNQNNKEVKSVISLVHLILCVRDPVFTKLIDERDPGFFDGPGQHV